MKLTAPEAVTRTRISHKDANQSQGRESLGSRWRKIGESIDEGGLVCGVGRWLGLMNMPMS